MERKIELKTNRTRDGKAKARLYRYYNGSQNRIKYAFKFYGTFVSFNTHKELREYILANHQVDIGEKNYFWF